MTGLPTDWRVAALDEIANITMGQSPPGSSYNENGVGVPFFQGKAEFTDTYPVVRKYTTAGTKFAEVGDILLSVRAPVGPTNLAPVHCVIGRGLASLRARESVNQRFLLWALRASEARLAAKGAGSTFPAITGTQLRSHTIALPPLDEQCRIVDMLEDHFSRLDAAARGLREGLAREAALRRALLSAAFSGRLSGAES